MQVHLTTRKIGRQRDAAPACKAQESLSNDLKVCYNLGVLKYTAKIAAFVLLLVLIPLTASAQTAPQAFLAPPDLAEFPTITSYLDVRDPQGYFISGLPTAAATVLEDAASIPGELTEQRPGAQIAVAINPGASFAIRDLEGNSRFAYLYQAIGNWIATQLETDVDDLSLVSPSGIQISHVQDPRVMDEVWRNYAVEQGTVPGPEVLSAALDLVLEPAPKPGMGRAVLLVTTALREGSGEVLQSLAERAAQNNVRVYVILVDSQAVFETNAAEQLRLLTVTTGGQFFTFSSNEPIPDFQQVFESARRVYQLKFRSRANVSGAHEITAVANTEGGEIFSQLVSYDVQVLPPSPILVAPPPELVRTIPADAAIAVENLAPRQHAFEVLTEFPDGYPREILRTALYLDGQLVAETLEQPFDRITMDLSPFEDDLLVHIRVEVTDELGLTGTTIETPVQITIAAPRRGLIAILAQNLPIVAFGVVLLAGGVFVLVLLLAGRLQPRPLGERRRKKAAYEDPVTQPIKATVEKKEETFGNVFSRLTRSLPVARLPWAQRRPVEKEPLAYLIRISEEGEPNPDSIYSITEKEITFGSDIGVSEVVLDDPAVEARHARLWQDSKGVFHIADHESVAGTWLNYAPVSKTGSQVEHGDLIHVAKVGFRFTLSRPTQPRRPVVVTQNKDSA